MVYDPDHRQPSAATGDAEKERERAGENDVGEGGETQPHACRLPPRRLKPRSVTTAADLQAPLPLVKKKKGNGKVLL